jgi:SAM-dependent methyltransferase
VSKETPWWRTFFDEAGGWASVHDAVISAEETQEQVETVARLLGLEPGLRVLDVACGDGRTAVPLAQRGLRVTGVELNARLLDRARAAAERLGLNVEWRQADMRELAWARDFDAAISLSGSFGYFDDGGNAEFATAVRRTLAPSGRFLVDTHIAETLLPILEERAWSRAGETVILQERRYDHERGRIDVDWTFIAHGRTAESRSSIRLYTYRELTELLRSAGFGRVDGYRARGEPFSVPGAGRMLAVAVA